MNDLLDFLKVAFESPMSSLVVIFLFIAAIKGTYEGVKWIKGELNRWYQNKHDEQEKDETIMERLEKLETENIEQTNRCTNITEALIQINEQIKDIRDDYNKVTVALTRASLHTLCHGLKDRDSITEAEYETFTDLRDVYLTSGGNAVFKNKIIPYIESLPVKD